MKSWNIWYIKEYKKPNFVQKVKNKGVEQEEQNIVQNGLMSVWLTMSNYIHGANAWLFIICVEVDYR